MAEINKVLTRVEPEEARWFRQEWEENGKMANEDDRPPTPEEDASWKEWLEDHKKIREEISKQQQEEENKITRTPLSKAVWDSNIILVQNLVKQEGVDLNQSDSDGRTPLGAAISKAATDNFEFVRLLVESGADINKKTIVYFLVTPFCAACQNAAGNVQLLQYMVEHGADTKGALSVASRKGVMIVVQVRSLLTLTHHHNHHRPTFHKCPPSYTPCSI